MHRNIVDKSSAYRAKGPGFKLRGRQEFINIKCMFCLIWEKNSDWGQPLKKIYYFIRMS